MTRLIAFFTVASARAYLLQMARAEKATVDYPLDVIAADEDLARAEKELRSELREEIGLGTEEPEGTEVGANLESR
jgi:hypothetical protein